MKDRLEESTLIKQAVSGSERAYEELVLRHQDMVCRVVYRITRRHDLVEDLAQEVFISVFQNLSRFRRQASFTTWLYRIAVNHSIEALRKESARGRLMNRIQEEHESYPDSLIIHGRKNGERMVLDRELQAQVNDGLGQLPPEQRAVLVLRYLEELQTPEIAEVLKLPEGTVRSRLYYARLKLAEVLEPVLGREDLSKKEKRE